MEQELQALKDELARVRAREKRFKDRADAEIAVLREQLVGMQLAATNGSTAVAELESRCQQQDAENAVLLTRAESLQTQVEALLTAQRHVEDQKSQLENRYMHSEEENTQLQKQLFSYAEELEKYKLHCQALERENNDSHKKIERLKQDMNLYGMISEKLPIFYELRCAADFLREYEIPFLNLLQVQETYSGLDFLDIIRRCNEDDVLTTVWKIVRKLVSKGDAESAAAKKCLQGILKWHNLYTEFEFQSFTTSPARLGFFGRSTSQSANPFDDAKVLVPGLANRVGCVILEPLLKPEAKK